MKRFIYKAKDKSGQIVTGEVEASSDQVAAKLVRSKGLIVISLKIKREFGLNLIKKFKDRITFADVSTFTRQLATMVNAGLPITEALVILRSQAKGSMQKMAAQVLADVEGGESLSTALSRHPKVFSPTYIALVKSGEVGGVMDEVLVRLADNLEKQQEFRGKVKGALIYPAIIVIGMLVVGLIMMIFVIPRLTSLYSEFNAELPTPTKILIGISTFVIRFWPLFLALFGGGLYGLSLYRKTPQGRRKTDELIFKIPIFGDLQRQVILTELTSTLSLMVGAGVSILEGLNITAGVVGNVVIADALRDTAKQVEKGFPVAFSFAKHPEAFPFILSQMVAVGEETGKMDEVLAKVSHIFEIESDQKVKTLTAAIEPLVMVLLGLGVGFLVIAIILPIYNLTSQF
ncbi:type II secretion system F family protein [Candidatus Woesebacteria bacterium]|nr:MAG: type II secretion system F family protein [Candidatus Woesebacteria bacterium]